MSQFSFGRCQLRTASSVISNSYSQYAAWIWGQRWCGRGDLNPHAFWAPPPQDGVSANFTTSAHTGTAKSVFQAGRRGTLSIAKGGGSREGAAGACGARLRCPSSRFPIRQTSRALSCEDVCSADAVPLVCAVRQPWEPAHRSDRTSQLRLRRVSYSAAPTGCR
jgi:hypothetical protein